jgi:hypothetical protein
MCVYLLSAYRKRNHSLIVFVWIRERERERERERRKKEKVNVLQAAIEEKYLQRRM